MMYTYAFKPVCDFMTGPELLQLQVLNKYMYDNFVPTYFNTASERKNAL